MQQMNNILLNSPEQGKKAVQSHSQSGIESRSSSLTNVQQDNRFSTELEKAANSEQVSDANQSVNKENQEPNKQTQAVNEGGLKESNSLSESSNDTAGNNSADADFTDKDDVSHVLAQINLASQLNTGVETDSQLAANGESLPLPNEADNHEAIDELTELSVETLPDEVLLTLSMQSGLTEQELSQLSEPELKALLQQGNFVDASGKPSAELLAAMSANNANSTSTNINSSSSGVNPTAGQAAETNSLNSAAMQNTVNTNQLDETKLAEAKFANDSKLPNENKDLFGKELNPAGANTAAESSKSTNNAELNAGSAAVANQTAANELLKNAELTVKMSPSHAGLEASLTSEPSAVQDSKSLTALQHQLQQTAANRQELPQLQASLKQAGEATPSMQQMIQRFAPVMNQQLITMVSNGVQQAEIRLDPPELGQMMVRIQVQGDNTQVQFQVSQHQTRDLVEQAMPRLREMLAEQGMQLTDGQVSQGNGGQGQGEGSNERGSGSGTHDMDEISAEDLLARSNLSTSSASGIDYYA
ncbi:flagellar hook-length control protein FliK [Shewanella pneumatophori]|uniref:Flagellar hook-length control protein FliK n=1 Tax=Shewanella pneumatophori TaxID=314092 RepID=A0A9X1ZHL0_9GAMM|nr:flagellar hook-length control protein FliK [Shewanella pneumatophori]MCL1139630.1 flagellar hook-length control protein FliK [Shewanella pneumatophori]